MAIGLIWVPIGVGVGIGIGIDPHRVLRSVLMHRVTSLPEFRQHCHDAVQQSFASRVLLWRKRPADLQDILNGSALQRRTACDLEIAPPITVGGLAVAFGNIQRDRLLSTQKLVLGVAMPLWPFAESVGPAHRLDRCAVYIQFLVSEPHPTSFRSRFR